MLKKKPLPKKNPLLLALAATSIVLIGLVGVSYVSMNLRSTNADISSDASGKTTVRNCGELNNKGEDKCESVSGCEWKSDGPVSCTGLEKSKCYEKRTLGCLPQESVTGSCEGEIKYCYGQGALSSFCSKRSDAECMATQDVCTLGKDSEFCSQYNGSKYYCELARDNGCGYTSSSKCISVVNVCLGPGACKGRTVDKCLEPVLNGCSLKTGNNCSFVHKTKLSCDKSVSEECNWNPAANSSFVCLGKYTDPKLGSCTGTPRTNQGAGTSSNSSGGSGSGSGGSGSGGQDQNTNVTNPTGKGKNKSKAE